MNRMITALKTEPSLETLRQKQLVGLYSEMSFANNKTKELWQTFMPRRKEIQNSINNDLYSLEIYSPGFFDNFNPAKRFQKWAAIEVTNFEEVPDDMSTLLIPAGQYAIFIHRGTAGEAAKTYRFIFETWMPGSGFAIDDRPHFAVMGEKYKNDDPESEEEIWIPVKPQ